MKKVFAHIKWIDPTVYSEWVDIDEITFDMDTLESYGMIVKENEKFIILALSLDESEGIRRINCAKIIPKSLILEIKKFHPAGKSNL